MEKKHTLKNDSNSISTKKKKLNNEGKKSNESIKLKTKIISKKKSEIVSSNEAENEQEHTNTDIWEDGDKSDEQAKEDEAKQDEIQKEETNNASTPSENATFEDLGLCEPLLEACKKMKWNKPSDIQRLSLPHSLAGKDIIALAETGSGKTGAFALPIIQNLLNDPAPYYALVLSPTRELAIQIAETFEALGISIGLRCVTVVGGVDTVTQAIALAKRPHVIVATPGRIVDHLENTKGFSLRNLKYLVFDEADRLLNMDFQEEIDKLLAVIPANRNTFLFSATMTSKVNKLQRASLRNPVKIEANNTSKYTTVKTLVQQFSFHPVKFKDTYLSYVLNEFAGHSTIVFTSTCDGTQRLAIMLRSLGFGAIPLHGKMSQPKRIAALAGFKSGSKNVLIATDVASRGLDIPSVDLVINYDIPTNGKEYIHRVGRTARAGRTGRAICFVTQYDVELFQRIENMLGNKMDAYPAQEDTVLLLHQRVSEAQRMAALEMKDMNEEEREKKKEGGKPDGKKVFKGGKNYNHANKFKPGQHK